LKKPVDSSDREETLWPKMIRKGTSDNVVGTCIEETYNRVKFRERCGEDIARSNVGIAGSNPTLGMDVCVYVYSVFVLSCL
jgi:hypothetical protein